MSEAEAQRLQEIGFDMVVKQLRQEASQALRAQRGRSRCECVYICKVPNMPPAGAAADALVATDASSLSSYHLWYAADKPVD